MNDIIIVDGVKYRRMEEEAAQKPRTGYERVNAGKIYYAQMSTGIIADDNDIGGDCSNKCYAVGNYYNNKTLAENNARADKLMRRLRQWQALNDAPVDWSDGFTVKYGIDFNYESNKFFVHGINLRRHFGQIYFSSMKTACEATDVFRDELLWYFTEYQQRLEEPKHS